MMFRTICTLGLALAGPVLMSATCAEARSSIHVRSGSHQGLVSRLPARRPHNVNDVTMKRGVFGGAVRSTARISFRRR
jgi:hypothetical protein